VKFLLLEREGNQAHRHEDNGHEADGD